MEKCYKPVIKPLKRCSLDIFRGFAALLHITDDIFLLVGNPDILCLSGLLSKGGFARGTRLSEFQDCRLRELVLWAIVVTLYLLCIYMIFA